MKAIHLLKGVVAGFGLAAIAFAQTGPYDPEQ